jgi:hypothetical protein
MDLRSCSFVDKPPFFDVIHLEGVPVERARVIASTALAVLCAVWKRPQWSGARVNFAYEGAAIAHRMI